MKKLFKQEWKYYLFFLLILTGLLLAQNGENYWRQMLAEWNDLYKLSEWVRYINLQLILYESTNILKYGLLSDVLIQVLAGLLIVKSIFFWQESVRSGREFICTLPVRRIDRMVFHFIMDSLLVIIPVAVYAANMYYRLNGFLVQLEIDIPWLGASIFGVTLTCIAYLLFLLGLINVLESLFASGFVRIIGTVGGIVAGYAIIDVAFTLNDGINWVQKLYGYLALKSAGGCYYLQEPANKGLSDDYGWVHKAVDYVMYYKGEIVTRPDTMPAEYAMYYADDISTISSSGMERIVDFSNMDSYIGYVLSYLVLAVLLAVLAAYLVKRQEASKSEFYFKAGRYLLCAEFSGFLTMIMLVNAVAVWHKCLIAMAGIMVF
ncbi:MAG: hypothetical protein K2H34_08070, partial [Lachnospiraceae bacterium]|nr:hypothetical protein [Lachnospiraceae bacterium]